jgi:hypothetical protein
MDKDDPNVSLSSMEIDPADLHEHRTEDEDARRVHARNDKEEAVFINKSTDVADPIRLTDLVDM